MIDETTTVVPETTPAPEEMPAVEAPAEETPQEEISSEAGHA
jgi:hypothetical protein